MQNLYLLIIKKISTITDINNQNPVVFMCYIRISTYMLILLPQKTSSTAKNRSKNL